MPADPAHADRPGRQPQDRPIIDLDTVLARSALLHAIRAATLQVRLEQQSAARAGHRSKAGIALARLGHRAAFARLLARVAWRSLRDEGPAGPFRRLARRASPDRAAKPGALTTPVPSETHDPIPAAALLTHRILIAAELSIPQCAKYRVWQKQQELASLGIPCTVIDWRRHHEAVSLLQTHTLLILYRVPGLPEQLPLFSEARRHGIETLWEVDDLIFDVATYAENANLRSLTRSERDNLLDGVALYRRALLAADAAIASTPELARLMAEATGRETIVIENALDAESVAFSERSRADADADADVGADIGTAPVTIVYGSGTSTHDADFAIATPALLRLLATHPGVRLRIVGELGLDPRLDAFRHRIERIGRTHFEAYLARVAECDIAIAPLEPTLFNDAKSNIKLIEASILGLPSVCSPAASFRDAITDGEDGFLAQDDAGWFDALARLVADADLRRRVGTASRARILQRYDPERIARSQTALLLSRMRPTRRARRRILVVNVFFAPQSFGGATIVAEEMATRLARVADTEVFVFTTRPEGAPYTLHRDRARGLDVFRVATRGRADDILNFDDPEMARVFEDVLDAVQPDLVHFHSIQTLGVAMLRSCQIRALPYVVTVHDAWWLCARQFMVRADNRYCHQRHIDLKVCAACIPHAHHLPDRLDILLQGLAGAALILSPSASHLSLYAANGLPSDRLRVHRNGIRPPARPSATFHQGPLRFGYVGGNERLKGVAQIKAAFAAMDRTDWVLVLVDNLLNLDPAHPSFQPSDWKMDGTVEIVPAYRQDRADEFFDRIDVLLFPSQWKESFGLTVREALVRDKWVVATECGGGAEQIHHDVNGTIIPLNDDPASLSEALQHLLQSADRIRAHRNPHKEAIATLDEQAAELDRFLSEVLP